MIEFVGVDHAAARILDRPDHSRHARPRSPAGRWRSGKGQRAGLVNRQLAAVPEGVLRMTVEQHAQLIHAVDDFVVHQPHARGGACCVPAAHAG